jgi:S1-C subfamily serine protease
VVSLAPGSAWGRYRKGDFCEASDEALLWEGGGREELDLASFEPVFVEELGKVGFKLAGDPTDLFAEETSGDFAVGAQIVGLNGKFCEGKGLNFGGADSKVNGRTLMEIEWQIYSPVQKAVVARVRTHQGYDLATPQEGGLSIILRRAFAENVRALAASEDFRKLVAARAPNAGASAALAGDQPRLALSGPERAGPRAIPDASGVVLTVFSSGGMGSGFLVSRDGYVLSNHHVVGDGKYVKLRWPDGIESVGEVVRSDKRRDVALIKTDPRGRAPLALRRTGLQAGDTVFAIGTPLDAKLQNTVTRGVVSGTRIFDGFNFIQSDVAVTSGNSGGPLLDEKGAAVGLTVAGYTPRGVSENINLFIPIGDALDFLAAEVR